MQAEVAEIGDGIGQRVDVCEALESAVQESVRDQIDRQHEQRRKPAANGLPRPAQAAPDPFAVQNPHFSVRHQQPEKGQGRRRGNGGLLAGEGHGEKQKGEQHYWARPSPQPANPGEQGEEDGLDADQVGVGRDPPHAHAVILAGHEEKPGQKSQAAVAGQAMDQHEKAGRDTGMQHEGEQVQRKGAFAEETHGALEHQAGYGPPESSRNMLRKMMSRRRNPCTTRAARGRRAR